MQWWALGLRLVGGGGGGAGVSVGVGMSRSAVAAAATAALSVGSSVGVLSVKMFWFRSLKTERKEGESC